MEGNLEELLENLAGFGSQKMEDIGFVNVPDPKTPKQI